MKMVSSSWEAGPKVVDVVYYGIALSSLPEGYLAVDEDGDLIHHQQYPECTINTHGVSHWYNQGDEIFLGKVDLEGTKWFDTLQKVVLGKGCVSVVEEPVLSNADKELAAWGGCTCQTYR